MKNDVSFLDKAWISREILRYLIEHPDSQDSVEGVVEWWLLERKITFISAKVEEALAELVSEGLIGLRKGADSKDYYRLNPDRINRIRELLENSVSEEGQQ